jgi:GAF domain-containing protein
MEPRGEITRLPMAHASAASRGADAWGCARRRALTLTSAAFVSGGAKREAVHHVAARLLAQGLESGCAIRGVDPPTSGAAAAVAHPSHQAQAWLRRLSRHDPAGVAGAFCARVLQTGEPIVLSVVSSALLRLWTSPVYWPYLDEHEVSGMLVVPLVARATIVGTLSLWRERPRGVFDDQDVVLVQEVARRLGLA